MIVYELGCGNEHRFEGWFASANDFKDQTESRLLICPLCGDERVARLPHAAHVSAGSNERRGQEHAPGNASEHAREHATEAARANAGRKGRGLPHHYANLGAELLAHVMDKVLENTEDVGRAFPEEARKIHYRETPERHIRGTASSKEVEALRDEGIEVVALPVPPHRLSRTH